VPNGVGAHTVSFTNKFDKTSNAPIKVVQRNLAVTGCLTATDPATSSGGPRQLLTVRGDGFARAEDGGMLVLTDGLGARLTPSATPV